MSKTLLNLQMVSLVSKVTQELENHIGIKDKVLAEFIINLAKECDNEKQFIKKLDENGADFTFQFSTNLFNLINKMMPKELKKKFEVEQTGQEESKQNQNNTKLEAQSFEENEETEAKKLRSAQFPALSLPNQKQQINEEELQLDFDDEKDNNNQVQQQQNKQQEKEDSKKDQKNNEKNSSQQDKSRDKSDKNDNKKSKNSSTNRKDSRSTSKDSSHSADSRSKRKKKRRWGPKKGGGSKSKSRSRSKSKEKVVKELEIDKVYNGTVTKVHDYGCFISIDNSRPRKEGLVHVSNIKEGRILNAFDVLRRNQKVKVKVLSIVGTKISLSMRDVHQETGEIIKKEKQKINEQEEQVLKVAEMKMEHNNQEFGEVTGIKLEVEENNNNNNSKKNNKQKRKRKTSHELWEDSRLKYNINPSYEDINNQESDEDVSNEDNPEIELIDKEAPFLAGQTTKSGINLSPAKIVKNPEGSMHRQALMASTFAQERREVREQQIKQAMDGNQKSMMDQEFHDPTADPNQRMALTGYRGLAQQALDLVPEWKKESFKKSYPFALRSTLPIQEQKQKLPIYRFKQDLIKSVKENDLLIVIGETGSGKTTQITQYLLEAGFVTNGKKIGCTQPRRVAAMSVAKRVAEEMGVVLGEEVGYSIRFEDCTSSKTIIKYMTDGMLLREALIDKNLSQYSCIMLDEAHERTVNTDVLFGIMKTTVQNRNDFKLIVTSATLDAEKFSSYFFNCNIFRIPGQTFPVDILYTKEPESDYMEAALTTIMQIHLVEPAGDILLFLTGQEEIDTSCQILYDRMKRLGPDAPELIILPVYSALPSEQQTRIFDPAPPGKRKVVIATNIAEASLTIDGIYYVVDPGFAKIKVYNPKMGMEKLQIAPISQASAKQRSGRAGRTGPGKCYRLYTEQQYRNEMLPTTVPEIQRTNLANTVLLLKAMGINDLINFDFMDPPPIQTLISALEMLFALSALDEEGLLSKLGRKMAEFPLEPQLSKMLLTAVDVGCVDEIITIIAMLTVQNVFYRPKDKQALADQKKSKFHQIDGDHLTLLAVYQAWKQNNFSNVWCADNFIQARSMRRAQDVRKQLLMLVERYKFPVKSCGADYSKIRKAITAGYFMHAAKKDPTEGYRTLVENQQIYIHPSSSLWNKSPEWVIYHELILTSKEYMREVCAIDQKWLVQVAGSYFKFSDTNTLSRRKRMEKIEPLSNKFEEANAWRLSRRKG